MYTKFLFATVLICSIQSIQSTKIDHLAQPKFVTTFENVLNNDAVLNQGVGILINASCIITPAEVLFGIKFNDKSFRVRAGSDFFHYGQIRYVKQVFGICFDPFDKYLYGNDLCEHHDIAIVILDRPFDLSKRIQPYKLPKVYDPLPIKGTTSTLFSFSLIKWRILWNLSKAIIEDTVDCEQHLHKKLASDQFCAQVNITLIKPGVPFFSNNILYGLANSSNMNKNSSNYYGVLTSIGAHRDWIYSKVGL